jgi:GcrA cell cycle regulator
LGLKKRQSPIRQSSSSAQPKKAKTVQAHSQDNTKSRPAPQKIVRRSGEIVRMEGLTSSMCCWPEGEPGTEDFQFCGLPAIPEKPYCEEHCARAYVKVSKDKRKKKGFEAA